MLRSKRSLAARQREMRKRQPARRGRGRPPLPISAETVANLAALGYKMLDIAAILGCSPNTIYKRFRADYEQGLARMTLHVLSLLFTLALEGDGRALRWQLKFRGLYGEELRKRARLSASLRAGSGAPRRGRGRRRILSGLAPKKAPAGAKIPRHVAEAQAVITPAAVAPATPSPPRRAWRSYEILL